MTAEKTIREWFHKFYIVIIKQAMIFTIHRLLMQTIQFFEGKREKLIFVKVMSDNKRGPAIIFLVEHFEIQN